MSKAPGKPYQPSLDGLRGVAALAVAGSHFENLSGYSLHLQHAGVAVDFFFILSGFVIAQAYESRLSRGLRFGAYMGIRLRRLYPAIAGGLLIGLLAALVGGQALYPTLAAEVLILPVLAGPVLHGGELFPLDGPLWSLWLEVAVNALHAAILPWLTTRRLVVVVALAAVALIAASLHFGGLDIGWSQRTVWGGPPRVVFGFGMGLLIFRLRVRRLKVPRAAYPAIVVALILCLVRPWPEAGLYAWTDPILVLLVLPVLVALAARSPVDGFLEGAARRLGAISYPLYAIHGPLLRLAEGALRDLSGQMEAFGWLLAAPAVIGLAVLFERAYDRPIRVWLAKRVAAQSADLARGTAPKA